MSTIHLMVVNILEISFMPMVFWHS